MLQGSRDAEPLLFLGPLLGPVGTSCFMGRCEQGARRWATSCQTPI